MMATGVSSRCCRRWYGHVRRWNFFLIGSIMILKSKLLCSSVVLGSVERVRFAQRDADEGWS